jgi:uncharacterized protein (DUF2141 family)
LIRYIFYFLIIVQPVFFISCANQLPPTGGPVDLIPPEIIRITPSDQSVNFTGRSIIIEFDDYIDRRSFQENFRIIPKPEGDISFDWSSRSVEVIFSRPLQRNRTYIISIHRGVRDLHGNILAEPVNVAFSTGAQLDRGSISGKVFSDNTDRIIVAAYLKTGKPESDLNPMLNRADYIYTINTDGSFRFPNLSTGEYRLFAFRDLNNNELFDSNEKIAMTFKDPVITSDSTEITGMNFLFLNLDQNIEESLSQKAGAATTEFLVTNFFDQTEPVRGDHRIYFYFRNNPFSREEISGSISIIDTVTAASHRLVFNWLSDNLLEVFSAQPLPAGIVFRVIVDLEGHGITLKEEKVLRVAGANDFSNISGEVRSDEIIIDPVKVKLINKSNFNNYTQTLTGTGSFVFENIPPGIYTLYAFIDSNRNDLFDRGSYSPFLPSEKFTVYENDITARARWNVEDIVLKLE